MSVNVQRTSADYGMAVDCWLEGMRAATGSAAWTRRGQALGAIRPLQAVLESCARGEGDVLAWSREVALEYAQAHRGASLSVFGFTTWLQSGKPAKAVLGANGKYQKPEAEKPAPIVVTREAAERAEREYQQFKMRQTAAGGGT